MAPREILCLAALVACFLASQIGAAEDAKPFRPPAIPLVTHNPYFSVWQMTDRLTDDWSKHWTGGVNALGGIAWIDGKPHRFAGMTPALPVMEQVGLEVTPTRSVYRFQAGGIEMTLTFMSPLLTDDIDVLTRPVSYVTFDVRSADDAPHDVRLYFDVTGEWAVHTADQQVKWNRYQLETLDVLGIGTDEQPILKRPGDGVRIDWGNAYLAVPGESDTVIMDGNAARDEFARTGKIPGSDDLRMPRAENDAWPTMVCSFDLGKVGEKSVSRHILIAYDEVYAIEFLQRRLRPYWRRTGMDVGQLLTAAEKDYASLVKRCVAFDKELTTDLTRLGGSKYASICAAAYRQCVAAHGYAADFDGTLLVFSKENTSNGCIGTVDVIHPTSPFFLLLNPDLLKANLTPVLEYASSQRWKWAFAPHDIGTYPLANGQVYGGGERTEENQMPVEESGNMLLMIAAISRIEGNADYAAKYWSVLTRWAEYLREKGMDPENQLCTDDFMGHLAHNANLSIKAIDALGAYALLAEMIGQKDTSAEYRALAEGMAQKWVTMAQDGDHYRLAFDKPGTWSQKYNLVWDKIVGLNLFPPEVARREIAYYKRKQDKFGLPLDGRAALMKTDALLMTITLAESLSDFEAFIDPVYDYFNRTTAHVGLADVYYSDKLDRAWLHSRPVIGGVYIKMLSDPAVWKKWAGRQTAKTPSTPKTQDRHP